MDSISGDSEISGESEQLARVTPSTWNVVARRGSTLLRNVGSFLGVNSDEEDATQWRHKLAERARAGQVGINLSLSTPSDTDEVILDHLKTAISSASQVTLFEGRVVVPRTEKKDLNIIEESETEQAEALAESSELKLTRSRSYAWRDREGSEASLQRLPEDEASVELSLSNYTASDDGKDVIKTEAMKDQDDFNNIYDGPSTVTFSPTVAVAEFRPIRRGKSRSLLKAVTHEDHVAVDTETEHVVKPILKPRPSEIGSPLKGAVSSYLNASNFVYRAEALDHYYRYVQVEQEDKIQAIMLKKAQVEAYIRRKQKEIDEALELTTAHFCGRLGSDDKGWRAKWNQLRGKSAGTGRLKSGASSPHIRMQLETMPVHVPWFIYLVSLTQVVVFIVLCVYGGITSIGLLPKLQLKEGVKTFRGLETISHFSVPNIWIGPPALYWINHGGLFAPCLRDDFSINLYYSQQHYTDDAELGCCEVSIRNTASTTTQQECVLLTGGVGVWKAGVCSERPSGQNAVLHNMMPCCIGVKGMCSLVTHEHCVFLDGTYHADGPEHCRLVNCLEAVCKMGGLASSPNHPYKPESPSQLWRWPLSLVYHHGIIHCVLMVAVQLVIGSQIEKLAGWLRLAIIYVFSGLLGLLLGSTFSPYHPVLGPDGAVFSLVGLLYVELAQSWQLLPSPLTELAKLLTLTAFFFLSGTLPFFNNFTLVGGFVSGVLLSIVLLPYITFSQWTVRGRRILIAVCTPVWFLIVFMVIFLFYRVQTMDSCIACQYFNCIPYAQDVCNTTELE